MMFRFGSKEKEEEEDEEKKKFSIFSLFSR